MSADEKATELDGDEARRQLAAILASRSDRGPLLTFEVTWSNGHVERVQGHQCTTPNLMGSFGLYGGGAGPAPRWSIHGEFDGHWQLVLSARDEDIRTVRNLSHEAAPGAEGGA